MFLSFCFLLFGSQTLHAQTPTQVIVAGADFSLPSTYVRVSTWDISSGTLTTFDSIPGSIAKHVFIWGNDAYVCTDSILLKYDLTTLQRVAEVKILGIQRIAVYLDKVIVTKGLGIEQSSSYLEVRYDANLGLTFTVPGVTDDCRGIVVVGDTAYIANPGLFVRLRGDMAVLDLPNQTLKRIASLDTMGRQIQDMYAVGNKIYSVNIQKYNNPTVGYISEYDIATMAFFHNRIPFPMSISAGIYNDLLYAQFGNYIGTWDINLRAFDDQTLVGGIFDALTIDSVNGVLYASQTDRVTQGKIYKYDMAAGVALPWPGSAA